MRSRTTWLGGAVLLVLAVGIVVWLMPATPARIAPRSPAPQTPVVRMGEAASSQSRQRDDMGGPVSAEPSVAGGSGTNESQSVEVHGFVLGPEGLPVAQAQLWSERSEWLADVLPNGEFVVRVGAGPKIVQARAGNAWSGPRVIRASDADSAVILRLNPASELAVQVISAQDYSPIRDARVWAVVASRPQPEERTRFDGTVHLALPPGSTENVRVMAEAAGWGRASRAVPVSRASGSLRRLTLELPRAAVVRGRVTWAGGEPALGARVTVRAENAASTLDVAEVDEEGQFTLEHLQVGTFQFEVQAAGAAIFNRVERIGPEGSSLSFELGGATALRGIVREHDGRTVADVVVEALIGVTRGFLEPQHRTLLTDASGQFELGGVGDSEVQLTAVRAHERSPRVTVPAGQRGPVELRLNLGGRISGTVRGSGGEPMPGAEISATQVRPSYSRLLPSARTRTNAEGAFELVGVAPGEWMLRARGPEDLLSSPFEGLGVTATAGDEGVVLTVAATGAIEAHVEFADGSQPEEVTVMLSGHDVPSVSAPDVLLAGIPAGVYDVLLTGPEFEPAVVPDVSVPAGDVAALERIVVRPGRTLQGTVIDARGDPVAGAKVVAGRSIHAGASSLTERRLEQEPASRVAYSGELGGFLLAGVVTEGPVAVMAEHPQFGRSPVVYTEDTHAPSALVLRLAQTTYLAGRVVEAEIALEGVAVIAESGKMLKFKSVTNAEGRYRIDGLAPDEYQVTAARTTLRGGLDLMRQSVQVSDKRPATLDFEFRGKTIHVTVRSQEGDSVLLRGPAIYLEKQRTSEGFDFSAVTPGEYTICVLGPKWGPGENCRPWEIQASPPRQSIAW